MTKEALEHKTFDPGELNHNHKEKMSDPTRAR